MMFLFLSHYFTLFFIIYCFFFSLMSVLAVCSSLNWIPVSFMGATKTEFFAQDKYWDQNLTWNGDKELLFATFICCLLFTHPKYNHRVWIFVLKKTVQQLLMACYSYFSMCCNVASKLWVERDMGTSLASCLKLNYVQFTLPDISLCPHSITTTFAPSRHHLQPSSRHLSHGINTNAD